jgi:DNA-binding transcriptional ArsR family regulator
MPTGIRAIDARVVKALGHPTRVRILAVLRDRELASPVELADELKVPLGTISYHVRRLETLGLIELATRTQRRGAVEHHYRAREALGAASRRPREDGNVRETAAAASRALADALRMLPAGGFDTSAARVEERTIALDEEGRAELDAEQLRWLGEIARIERDSARRLAVAGADQGRVWTVVAIVFDVDGAS